MKTFHIPGFTADASLNKARKHYGLRTKRLTGAEARILPARKVSVIGHGPGKSDICRQVGDLINEVEDMADDAASSGDVDGYRDALAIIRAFESRSGQKWGCKFS
jgi:hypothetical protein